MDIFLNSLKGQVNTFNLFQALLLTSCIFWILRKKKIAFIFAGITLLFFLLVSTSYLPSYLVGRIESQHSPFKLADLTSREQEPVFVHVLGGGYTYDSRLPAQGQLSTQSLGRLVEGIRIVNDVQNCRLVFSGNKVSGKTSMAHVMREAAISLGVDPSMIELLEEASNTQEEAEHFVRHYGNDVVLIVVTDAVHMPRAIRSFNEEGISPHAAPTNYLIQEGKFEFSFRWVPSAENFLLMDRVLRESLGSIKANINS